ncbi:g7828 [Coccomyxa viridis]|uniref:G7828 protein n=1 Tax=Coccomyxa viridis TaxID=1274662 RepID=A0ABP1FYU9_9CHLO
MGCLNIDRLVTDEQDRARAQVASPTCTSCVSSRRISQVWKLDNAWFYTCWMETEAQAKNLMVTTRSTSRLKRYLRHFGELNGDKAFSVLDALFKPESESQHPYVSCSSGPGPRAQNLFVALYSDGGVTRMRPRLKTARSTVSRTTSGCLLPRVDRLLGFHHDFRSYRDKRITREFGYLMVSDLSDADILSVFDGANTQPVALGTSSTNTGFMYPSHAHWVVGTKGCTLLTSNPFEQTSTRMKCRKRSHTASATGRPAWAHPELALPVISLVLHAENPKISDVNAWRQAG